MSFQVALREIGCGGFIAEFPHQTASDCGDRTAADPLSYDVRKPIKDWHPPLSLWRCGNFGRKKDKPKQYCPNFVDDDYGFEHASTRCLTCRKRDRKYKETSWASLMVKDARSADKRRLQLCDEKRKFVCIDWNRYITKEYLLSVYDMCKGMCWWCGVKMDTKKRQSSHGLTVDRLNDQPHYIGSCALACLACNANSWRQPNKVSFFKDLPSLTSDKLRFYQTYYTGWARFQRLRLALDSQHR